MNIMQQVEMKKSEFLAQTNRKPGRLLAGELEIKALGHEALVWGIPRLTGYKGDERPRVSGLFLYEMDDKSYLEVAP